LAAVTAVSRAEDKIDLFVTDQNGVVVTAGWEPSFTDGWQGWYKLAGGLAQAGAPVLAASRSRDIVNAFVIGTDGRVYMAASERSITDGWQAGGTSTAAPQRKVHR
jgi:hypothetical protein